MTLDVPPPVRFRGSTILFSTTFYDATGAAATPTGAVVNISYQDIEEDSLLTTSITMTAPGMGQTAWTAEWDSRDAGPGPVAWSIHSTGSATPFSVEDGRFTLTANNANQPF